MAEVLADFIRRAASEKRVAGEWDCAMTVANWVRAATGRDPAAGLRGAYGEDEWPTLVEREGGLVALVGRLAAGAGMKPTDDPKPGDIGVVQSRIGPMGAIRTERGWAVKVNDGIVVTRAEMLAAWGF